MFQSALIPISFRESTAKLRGLFEFLHYFGTQRAELLHVISSGHGERNLRRLETVRELLLENADGIEVATRVTSGSAAMEISRVAREIGASFVSVPWKRKNWLQRTLVGSTTKDIIRLSDHPLFIYKGFGTRSVGEKVPFVVLYATALGGSDETVLPFLNWSGLAADPVVLVHVGPRAPDPVAEERRKEEVDESLRRLAERCNGSSGEVEMLNLTGSPGRAIRQAARRRQANLLVIGKSERSAGLTGSLGSTAATIAYNASQSVFIVGRRIPDAQ